jgi:hypothetical protein
MMVAAGFVAGSDSRKDLNGIKRSYAKAGHHP